MADEKALQELIDRAAITDITTSYATAVDTRDWELFQSLFNDPLFLDFSSFHPSLKREITVAELLDITRKLASFDSTQHMITNHRFDIDGDRATCIAYTQAGHFLTREGEDHACFLHGYYTFELERTGGKWKVDRYGLQITAQDGNPQIFEWVGLL